MGGRQLKIRLHIGIAALVTTIVLAATGLTLASVYLASTRAARESAAHLFSEVAARTYDRVNQQITATLTLARTGPLVPGAGERVSGDGRTHPAAPFLMRTLELDPTLYSAYYGLADGSFLQLINARGDSRVLDAHKAPAGTQMIVRAIVSEGEGVGEGGDGTRVQRWTFLDGAGAVLAATEEASPSYDPRARPWYKAAAEAEDAQLSDPYIFNSLKQPGITVSHHLAGGAGVFGVDISLNGLDRFVEAQEVSEHGGVVIYDEAFRLLAAPDRLIGADPGLVLADVRKLDKTLVALAVSASEGEAKAGLVERGGDAALVHRSSWQGPGGKSVEIAIVAPFEDFIGHIRRMQWHIALVALAVLAVVVPVSMLLAHRIARVVRHLARDAERVQHLDFSGGAAEDSFIREFHALGEAFGLMKDTLSSKTAQLEQSQDKLERLVEIGIALSSEKDSHRLMEMLLLGAKELTGADGGSLYIRTDDDKLAFQIVRNDTLNIQLGGTSGKEVTLPPVPMFDDGGGQNHRNVVSHAVHQAETVVIDDAYDDGRFDFSGTKKFDASTGYRSQSFLTVPLKPRGGDVIGALQLINAQADGRVVPFKPEVRRFVEALAAQAATAMYNRSLLDAQERLMDAMIQILAGSIDAKSPYTGGHCERVPELAVMLAEEATRLDDGPLAEFAFTTDDEWREFRIGAWLHDCGKVTTPEYVVDKATKLETIYNRIHEVRMRFEVLLRDAEIAHLKAVASGVPAEEADAAYDAARAKLFDDFAFVAECNVGGEFMAPDKVERLKVIAETTWTKNFNDRLGLAHEELKRFQLEPEETLPAPEKLLFDKPRHVIPRTGKEKFLDDRYGFKIKIPEHMYNFGEIYNLSVSRGTLSEEERFKINEHIIQTIIMLETLPFPKELRRVPEYAGAHHETLIGSGYPRKLDRDGLSIPARIMAIADIFEALTASDRPYKKAKTLSEAVHILSFFKKDQHIDPDLFDLFLTSGVYKRYAERFLLPEQLDEVDVGKYVNAPAPAAAQ